MNNDYVKATKIFAVFTFAISLPVSMFAPYIKSLGLSDIQLSIFFSALPLTMFIISPLIGRISDKIGRNSLITYILAMEMIAALLYFFSESIVIILIARFLDVIAVSSLTTLGIAGIEDHLKERERGKYSGISFSFQSIGKIAAPFIGGILADFFFIKSPFIVMAIVLAIIISIPKKSSTKHKIAFSDLSWFSEIKEFFSFRKLKGMAIMGIVFHASLPLLNVFLPLFIMESLGLSYFQVGLAIFLLQFTHIFQFIFGRWVNKDPHKFIAFGSTLSGVSLALIFFVDSYYALLFLLFIKGIGNSFWNIAAWTLMSRVGVKHKIEGEVVGSYISISKLGAFVSFLISGLIVESFGISILFLLNGLFIIFGISIAYNLLRDSKIHPVKLKA